MRSDDDDPEFITSVGFYSDLEDALSVRAAEILYPKISAAGSTKLGRSCNREESGWKDRLCATTNTQGRFSNGVREDGKACTEGALAVDNSNKFLHVESSYDLNHDDGPTDPIGPNLITQTLLQLLG